jgi:mono/diheme cytochrome c family protein
MRHFLANIALYVIAAFLVSGAALFALMRSTQFVLTDEETMLAHYRPAAGESFEWRELGERTYVANCAGCHGRDGTGRDQYPPLATAAALLPMHGGREYLIDLHLYGLASARRRAPMPPMGHIPDVALAAAMNHVLVEFGQLQLFAPAELLITPAEIAARRGAGIRPQDVEQRRPR